MQGKWRVRLGKNVAFGGVGVPRGAASALGGPRAENAVGLGTVGPTAAAALRPPARIVLSGTRETPRGPWGPWSTAYDRRGVHVANTGSVARRFAPRAVPASTLVPGRVRSGGLSADCSRPSEVPVRGRVSEPHPRPRPHCHCDWTELSLNSLLPGVGLQPQPEGTQGLVTP